MGTSEGRHPPRHVLVRLRRDAVWQALGSADRERLAGWFAAGRPAVLARRQGSEAPGGAGVCWRELAGGAARVLVKTADAVVLLPRSAVYESLAAALHARGEPRPRAERVCREVARRWGSALGAAPLDPISHGRQVARRYDARGARAEAMAGFPVLQDLALPTLRACRAAGLDQGAALCHTLMKLVSDVADTNLLHRGGAAGLDFARAQAVSSLANGGARAPDWRDRLSTLADAFAARRLSPGGSADLLACSWFLVTLEAV